MKRFLLALSIVVLAASQPASGQDKIQKAKECFRQGDYQAVIDGLRSTPATDIHYKDALLLLSQSYLAVGQADSAEARGRILLGFNDKNIEAILAVNRALVAQKKIKEAYTLIRKGLKSKKNHAGMLIQLGNVHSAADSVEQAIVAYAQAKESDPKALEAYIGLGESYRRLQACAVAILQYEEAAALDSSRCDLKLTLARLYRQEQRYNDAARSYIAAINCSEDKVTPSLELGTLYILARQYGNAANILANYVTVHPEDLETWAQFNEAVDQAKAWSVGLDVADSILARDAGNVQALKLAAKSSNQMGKATRSPEKHLNAIELFGRLAKIQPLDAEDTKYLGKAHFELRNDTTAIRHLKRSWEMDTTQTDVPMDLGSAYMRVKDWNRASAMFATKIRQDSTSTAAYVNYALCEEQMNNWDNARRALIRGLKQAPNYVGGHYYLAYALQRMDSVQAAKREYETVIALADTQTTRYRNELGDSYRYLAFVGLYEKNYPAALMAIESAMPFRPNDWELALWHAQTLHAMSRRDEARREYERIVRAVPKRKEGIDAQRGLDRLDLGF
ncbi:tetratricopeptide repeat protein [bacterium]|nr:tetratricopeptide repeat protein [bacterium]